MPADIRRAAGERSSAEDAAGAWETVARLARNCRSAVHPDPVAEEAVKRLGGWIKIGLADEDRLVWIRKEFLELYQDSAIAGPGRLAAGEAASLSGPRKALEE